VLEGIPIRDGLDYVKIDKEIYVECITSSFLAYGFNDNFLSSNMFKKYHAGVEHHLLRIPEEFLKEYQQSHQSISSHALRYNPGFLKWYLFSKCKVVKDGKSYIQIGRTQFLKTFIEDFLEEKNFIFLDALPVLSSFSKSIEFMTGNIVFWVFSYIFRRQYNYLKSFYEIYTKLRKIFEHREFNFAFVFWKYLMDEDFSKKMNHVGEFIKEYTVGRDRYNWGLNFDDLIKQYYKFFCGSLDGFNLYRKIMSIIKNVLHVVPQSFTLCQSLIKNRKSIYLGMMKYMISKNPSRTLAIRMDLKIAKLDNPVNALASILEKYLYIDNLAVLYELGCERLEIFSLEEITEAVAIAAEKQHRHCLVDEWDFLRGLILERIKQPN